MQARPGSFSSNLLFAPTLSLPGDADADSFTNVTRSDTPDAISETAGLTSATGFSTTIGSTYTQYAWYKTPYFARAREAYFSLSISISPAVPNSTAAGEGRLHFILTDYDTAALTWNTQAALLTGTKYITITAGQTGTIEPGAVWGSNAGFNCKLALPAGVKGVCLVPPTVVNANESRTLAWQGSKLVMLYQ